MRAKRLSFERINMLTGTRYIQITAAFVRRFAGLADLMNGFTEHAAFEESLATSVRNAHAHARHQSRR
jgi:phage regulator Rha-like protein